MSASDTYAEIALPLPLEKTFTYRVPHALVPDVTLGCQVLVPFRGRSLTGFVVALGARAQSPPGVAVKDVKELIGGASLVTSELLQLARWIARYYLASLGEVLHAVFPPGVARRARRRVRVTRPPTEAEWTLVREQADVPGALLDYLLARGEVSPVGLARRFGQAPARRGLRKLVQWGVVEEISALRPQASGKTVRMIRRADRARTPAVLEHLRRRAPVQARCLEVLAQDEPLEASRLLRLAQAGAASLARLRERELVIESFRAVTRRPSELEEIERVPRPQLTPHQEQAVAAIRAGVATDAFQVYLVHGITASGKTEVYLQAIEAVLARGRTAIVLVPEIALAPQTVRQVVGRFGTNVAVLHSRLAAGERYDAWHQIRRGEVGVVVGARSAVFAPLEKLGLIVVDEEQEGSYKQDEAPRYHARQAAIMRARYAGAVVLLGSATPSLESYRQAAEGKYTLLTLPKRVDERPLPQGCVIDLRKEGGKGPRIISNYLRTRIEERLRGREQVILFLNRRGFAPFVQCPDCGWTGSCSSCDLTLTYHARGHHLRCHYCDHLEPAPAACPQCRGNQLDFKGVGTQRVEAEVTEAFPEARVARMDFDSTRTRGAHTTIYRSMLRGDIDVLLGTQMVAKGLHFPRVGLVGVITGDVALNLPDFRATEKTFQLLTQVGGRAGRGDETGEVVIQTYAPNHHGIVCAAGHDYAAFYEREIKAREELLYPPFSRVTRFVLRGEDPHEVEEEGQRLRSLLERELTRADAEWHRHGKSWFRLVGPAEAPLARIRNRHRRHLLIKSGRWEALHDLVRAAARRFREEPGPSKGRVELAVDVDPVNML